MLLTLLSCSGFAVGKETPRADLILSPLQYHLRYSKEANTEINWQGYYGFGVGGQWQRHILMIDYLQSSTSSGNSTLAFKKDRAEWMISYKYNILALNSFLNLQAGLGFGFYNDKLQSRLGAQVINEESGAQNSMLALVGLGGHWKFLFYAAEIQAISGKDFDPQPTLGGLFRIGLQFAIF